MTDEEQETTQEPEPITPDNNFPLSLPSLLLPSSGKPDIHTSVRRPIQTLRIRKFSTSVAILLRYRPCNWWPHDTLSERPSVGRFSQKIDR